MIVSIQLNGSHIRSGKIVPNIYHLHRSKHGSQLCSFPYQNVFKPLCSLPRWYCFHHRLPPGPLLVDLSHSMSGNIGYCGSLNV